MGQWQVNNILGIINQLQLPSNGHSNFNALGFTSAISVLSMYRTTFTYSNMTWSYTKVLFSSKETVQTYIDKEI